MPVSARMPVSLKKCVKMRPLSPVCDLVTCWDLSKDPTVRVNPFDPSMINFDGIAERFDSAIHVKETPRNNTAEPDSGSPKGAAGNLKRKIKTTLTSMAQTLGPEDLADVCDWANDAGLYFVQVPLHATQTAISDEEKLSTKLSTTITTATAVPKAIITPHANRLIRAKTQRKHKTQHKNQPSWTKVFVENIPRDWDEEKLLSVFSEHGTISFIAIVRPHEDEADAFGFVEYKTHESAVSAVQKLPDGPLRLVVTGCPKRTHSKRKHQLVKGGTLDIKALSGQCLVVRNLGEDCTDEVLRDLCSRHGSITGARVMRHKNGRSRGFGFVLCSNRRQASKTKKALHNRVFMGRCLRVTRWKTQKIQGQFLCRLFELRVPKSGVPGSGSLVPISGSPKGRGKLESNDGETKTSPSEQALDSEVPTENVNIRTIISDVQTDRSEPDSTTSTFPSREAQDAQLDDPSENEVDDVLKDNFDSQCIPASTLKPEAHHNEPSDKEVADFLNDVFESPSPLTFSHKELQELITESAHGLRCTLKPEAHHKEPLDKEGADVLRDMSRSIPP